VDVQRIFAAGVQYLLLLLSLSARESFKAWTAERCGDSTGRLLGRVTLNPLRHLELVGSILLPIVLLLAGFLASQGPMGPILVFGWGRPVPVMEKNLRDPYRDGLLIGSAGPFCSFMLALLGVVALLVAVRITGQPGEQAAQWALAHQWQHAGAPHFPLMFTLIGLVTVNGFLTAFHLIPLPPLDGGRIALHLLPPDWAAKLAAIRPAGFMIGLALALLVVGVLVLPLMLIILSVLIQFVA
jgi:Zn-dependent protease